MHRILPLEWSEFVISEQFSNDFRKLAIATLSDVIATLSDGLKNLVLVSAQANPKPIAPCTRSFFPRSERDIGNCWQF